MRDRIMIIFDETSCAVNIKDFLNYCYGEPIFSKQNHDYIVRESLAYQSEISYTNSISYIKTDKKIIYSSWGFL